MPQISIIIPNYNHALYLKQRIDSVLNQTFLDFEVIILDDRSHDNSKEIIEQYRGHPKVSQIVYNEVNSGSTFKQWQQGIQRAKGNLIWLAESDDFCKSTLLEDLYSLFEKNENLVLAYCRSNIVDSNGSILNLGTWADALDNKRWHSNYVNDGISEIKDFLLYRNIVLNASSALFKKDVFLNIPTEAYMSFRYSGDWMVWAKILESGDIGYLHKPLNNFRTHKLTTRNKSNIENERKRFREYFRVIRYIEQKHSVIAKKEKHQWIIDEWIDKRDLAKINFLKYILPPIPTNYISMFYRNLLRKLLSK